MSGISTLMLGFQQIISEPIIFVLLVLGVFMGIVFGSIPGLTGALAISLVLPFTYHMTANNGLSLLIAIYVGSISGGLISAILMNIPGTPRGNWGFTFSFDWWQEGFSEGLRYLSALFGRNEQAEKAAEETDEFLR